MTIGNLWGCDLDWAAYLIIGFLALYVLAVAVVFFVLLSIYYVENDEPFRFSDLLFAFVIALIIPVIVLATFIMYVFGQGWNYGRG